MQLWSSCRNAHAVLHPAFRDRRLTSQTASAGVQQYGPIGTTTVPTSAMSSILVVCRCVLSGTTSVPQWSRNLPLHADVTAAVTGIMVVDRGHQVPSTPGRLRRARCLRDVRVSMTVPQIPRIARGDAIAHHPRRRDKDVQASVCDAVLLRCYSLFLLSLLGTTAESVCQRRRRPHGAHLDVRLSSALQRSRCKRMAGHSRNQQRGAECVGAVVQYALRPGKRAWFSGLVELPAA